jgi:hypothetical protein
MYRQHSIGYSTSLGTAGNSYFLEGESSIADLPFFCHSKKTLGKFELLREFSPKDAWNKCCSTYILRL